MDYFAEENYFSSNVICYRNYFAIIKIYSNKSFAQNSWNYIILLDSFFHYSN
jgi:hypothetical protein